MLSNYQDRHRGHEDLPPGLRGTLAAVNAIPTGTKKIDVILWHGARRPARGSRRGLVLYALAEMISEGAIDGWHPAELS